jgi:hypothetical protein
MGRGHSVRCSLADELMTTLSGGIGTAMLRNAIRNWKLPPNNPEIMQQVAIYLGILKPCSEKEPCNDAPSAHLLVLYPRTEGTRPSRGTDAP